MLTLLDDSEEFNTEALRAAEEIDSALAEISRKHDSQHWHAALAVFVASAIRQARLEQGIPDATAFRIPRRRAARRQANQETLETRSSELREESSEG